MSSLYLDWTLIHMDLFQLKFSVSLVSAEPLRQGNWTSYATMKPILTYISSPDLGLYKIVSLIFKEEKIFNSKNYYFTFYTTYYYSMWELTEKLWKVLGQFKIWKIWDFYNEEEYIIKCWNYYFFRLKVR